MFLKDVPFIKAKMLDHLEKMNLHTVADVLWCFPRSYEDRRNLKTFKELYQKGSEQACVTWGTITRCTEGSTSKGLKTFEVLLKNTGDTFFTLIWFKATPKFKGYLRQHINEPIMVYGEPKFYKRIRCMFNPAFEIGATPAKSGIHFLGIIPVYALTKGLYQEEMRKFMFTMLSKYSHTIGGIVPKNLEEMYHLPDFHESLQEVHFPRSQDFMKLLNFQTKWHKRLIYEELIVFTTCIELIKVRNREKKMPKPDFNIQYMERMERLVMKNAGFKLTSTQKQANTDLLNDMVYNGQVPMRRLLHGDVGTGKTIVALHAALLATALGYQTAFMAPTEILANQHYKTLQIFLAGTDYNITLLTSSVKNSERKDILNKLKSGEIHCLLGTHALIQDSIKFKNLGLAIVDEQHKFGAVQRTKLAKKSKHNAIHFLQLSATPIPRTILMTLYGDLDVSTLMQIPGKQYAKTVMFEEFQQAQLYAFLGKHLKEGAQIYIVYPLIEDSDKIDLKSAISMHAELQEYFHQYTVGLVHGRMKKKEQDAVMLAFRENKINMLVATTVIEVGVDVSNATVMVVEHAERFGLSQLHQLRGRVGRGHKESYCVLVPYRDSERSERRLDAMLKTNDGFKIAEHDMSIRGPGDYFGTEQHGFDIHSLRLSDLTRDIKALEYARHDAQQLAINLERYPELAERVKSKIDTVFI